MVQLHMSFAAPISAEVSQPNGEAGLFAGTGLFGGAPSQIRTGEAVWMVCRDRAIWQTASHVADAGPQLRFICTLQACTWVP